MLTKQSLNPWSSSSALFYVFVKFAALPAGGREPALAAEATRRSEHRDTWRFAKLEGRADRIAAPQEDAGAAVVSSPPVLDSVAQLRFSWFRFRPSSGGAMP